MVSITVPTRGQEPYDVTLNTALNTLAAAIPADIVTDAALDTSVTSLIEDPASDAAVALNATIGAAVDAGLAGVQSGQGEMFLGLAAALSVGVQSTGVYVAGDSTTVPDTAWFRLFAEYIAAEYPAYTCRYWKWNNTTQRYDRPIVLNSGGAQRAMVMAAGGTRVGRSMAGANITGPIEIIAYFKSSAYSPSTTQVIASKWTSDTQVSWQFDIGGDNVLRFRYSTDGTTTTTSMSATAAHGMVDGTAYFLRVQFTPDNGSGSRVAAFHRSTDGVTWTQIGTTVTTAGTAVVFQGTSSYTVGARGSATSPWVAGTEFYELWINDGIGGGSVVPPLVHTWPNSIGTGLSTVTGAPEVNLVLGAQSGAGIGYAAGVTGYLTDDTRFPKLAVDLGQQVAMFNSSHNEYDLTGKTFEQKYMSWVDATTARMPLVSRIALTQNPQTVGDAINPASGGHQTRRTQMMSFGRANGVDVIDTYKAFLDDGRALSVLIEDGTHPDEIGYSEVWWPTVQSQFDAAAARV